MLKSLIWKIIKGYSIEKLIYLSIKYNQKGGKYKQLGKYFQHRIQRKYACYISAKAIVGTNVDLRHPVGIVIGDGVVIANNVVIYQNVTIGAARLGEGEKGLYPKIGDNVIIFAGAKIIGGIVIGDNAIIGANSVVLNDVPCGARVVGAPAKQLK